MKRFFIFGLTVGWAVGLLAAVVAAQQVGDTVVVIRETPVRDASRTVQLFSEGARFQVREVNGEWLLPDLPYHMGMPRGWVQRRDVLKLDQALKHYSNRIQTNARDANAYFVRSQVLGELAYQDELQARQLGDDPEAKARKVALYDSFEDKNSRAHDDLSACLRLAPQNAWAWEARGNLSIDVYYDAKSALRDLNEAIRLFEATDTAALYKSRAYCKRGLAKLALDDERGALADFNQSLRWNKDNAYAYYGRSIAYEVLGNEELRRQDADRAKAYDPSIVWSEYFDILEFVQ